MSAARPPQGSQTEGGQCRAGPCRDMAPVTGARRGGCPKRGCRGGELDGASLLGSVTSVPLTTDHRGAAEQTQVWTSGLCLDRHLGLRAQTWAAGESWGLAGWTEGQKRWGEWRTGSQLCQQAHPGWASVQGAACHGAPVVSGCWRAVLPTRLLPPATGGVQKRQSAQDCISECFHVCKTRRRGRGGREPRTAPRKVHSPEPPRSGAPTPVVLS